MKSSSKVTVVQCVIVTEAPNPNATVAEGCPPGKYNLLLLVHWETQIYHCKVPKNNSFEGAPYKDINIVVIIIIIINNACCYTTFHYFARRIVKKRFIISIFFCTREILFS